MTAMRDQSSAVARRFLRAGGAQGGWAIAEYAAFPLLMFAATPFFIHTLGVAQYGQWMLLLTFNGLGGVAGLGMGAAAIKEVSGARGRGDSAAAHAAVRSCLAVTMLSSLALASVIAGIGLTYGPELLGKMGSTTIIHVVFMAAAILIAIEQVDSVFAGVLRGFERFDLSARIEVVSKFTTVVAAIAIAALGHELIPVIASTIILTIGRAMLKGWFAGRQLGIGWILPAWDPVIVRRVFSFGKWTWLQSVGAALFATGDRLLVGGLLGADALARYSVCLQLAQQIQAIPAAAAQTMFPMISRKIARDEAIATPAIRATMILTALAVAIAVPLLIFGHTILTLWVGRAFADAGGATLSILTVAFMMLAINNVPHFVLLGLNRSMTVALCNIGAGFASLVTAFVFIHREGLEGAALGRVVYGVVACAMIVIMLGAVRSSLDHNRLHGAHP